MMVQEIIYSLILVLINYDAILYSFVIFGASKLFLCVVIQDSDNHVEEIHTESTNGEISEDSLEEKVTYCKPIFFGKGQIMMIINMRIP
jgi:hypothetical protein